MIIVYILIGYILYGGLLVWRDFHMNFIDRPLYLMQKPNLKMVSYIILIRPYLTLQFWLNQIISDFKQAINDNKKKQEERLTTEKRENEQAAKDIKNYEFFEKNIQNSELMSKGGGDFNIEPGQIGKVLINDKNKTIKIEIIQAKIKHSWKEGASYQVPYHTSGHLLCENTDYKIIESEHGDAVFMSEGKDNPGQLKPYGRELILCKDDNNPLRLSLTIINNLQGIKIVCDRINVIDFSDMKFNELEKYRDIVNGCSYGKFFSVQYEQ